jgi:hypothetical protein
MRREFIAHLKMDCRWFTTVSEREDPKHLIAFVHTDRRRDRGRLASSVRAPSLEPLSEQVLREGSNWEERCAGSAQVGDRLTGHPCQPNSHQWTLLSATSTVGAAFPVDMIFSPCSPSVSALAMYLSFGELGPWSDKVTISGALPLRYT